MWAVFFIHLRILKRKWTTPQVKQLLMYLTHPKDGTLQDTSKVFNQFIKRYAFVMEKLLNARELYASSDSEDENEDED